MKKLFRLACLSALLLTAHIPSIAQKQWSVVGSAGFSTDAANFLSFAVDNTGTPWVAYQDNLKATVMKYGSGGWAVVGSAGFSPGTASYFSLAVDKKGTPYVAMSDYANGVKLSVMKYNGSAWVMVGAPGISNGVVGTPSMAVDSAGIPYVAYMDNVGNSQLWVKKFNGASWVQVGSAASLGLPDNVDLKFDHTNTPWIAYRDFAYNARLTVVKLTGSSWTVMGGYGFSMGNVSNRYFDFDNADVPYVAQTNFTTGLTSQILKYNGSNWVDIGNTGIPAGATDHFTSLAVNNNNAPFLAYSDYLNGSKAAVMKFDGSSWVNAGNTDFSAGGVSGIIIAFDKHNNVPFVAYVDSANGNKATVMKLECAPRPQVNICAALVDTVSSKNTIVWDNSALNVMAYKIFREDFGIYTQVGNVAGNVNSFVDPSANSAAQSYRYKLVAVDSCEWETNLDDAIPHRTMRVAFNYLLNDQASISWNVYEGLTGPTYNVKRSNNSGPFITIASLNISGADTTYIDNHPPAGSNRYRIDIPLGASCSGVSSITSNIANAWNTGIHQLADDMGVSLTPNPATNTMNMSIKEPITGFKVLDLTGKILMQLPGNLKTEMTTDVSNLPQGMYMIRVNDRYNAVFVKN